MSAFDCGRRVVSFMGEPLTRREARLARYVFSQGVDFALYGPLTPARVEAEAAGRFPLPMVTRPRVLLSADGVEWRCVDGVIQWRNVGHPVPRCRVEWSTLDVACGATMERVRLWADLLANPTETIEEPG